MNLQLVAVGKTHQLTDSKRFKQHCKRPVLKSAALGLQWVVGGVRQHGIFSLWHVMTLSGVPCAASYLASRAAFGQWAECRLMEKNTASAP